MCFSYERNNCSYMIMIAAKAFFLFFCYILLRYETFVIALEEALKDMLPSLKDRAMKVDNCTFHCFKPRTLHLHPLRPFSTLSLCSFFFQSVFVLLKSKSEQERRLLTALVNKVSARSFFLCFFVIKKHVMPIKLVLIQFQLNREPGKFN